MLCLCCFFSLGLISLRERFRFSRFKLNPINWSLYGFFFKILFTGIVNIFFDILHMFRTSVQYLEYFCIKAWLIILFKYKLPRLFNSQLFIIHKPLGSTLTLYNGPILSHYLFIYLFYLSIGCPLQNVSIVRLFLVHVGYSERPGRGKKAGYDWLM